MKSPYEINNGNSDVFITDTDSTSKVQFFREADEHSTPVYLSVLGAVQVCSAYTTSTPNCMNEVKTPQARAFTPVDCRHAQRADSLKQRRD
jgi:hypothetical protein